MIYRILITFLLLSLPIHADQYDSRLKVLFNQLLETNNEEEIINITLNIWDIWHETNDPKIEADFYRGLESMRTGDLIMSIAFFTRVIEQKPNFAEAWNKRATVYYMLGKFDKSMIDINETLRLEPRHFGAMDGMALIFIHQEKFLEALKIYDEIIKIFPKSKTTLAKKKMILNQIAPQA